MSMLPIDQTVTDVTDSTDHPWLCEAPGCDRAFETKQGRGRHMQAAHAIPGKSAGAQKKRKSTEPRTKTLIASDGEFGVEGLLQAFFPNGVPSEKIPVMLRWIEITKEMME